MAIISTADRNFIAKGGGAAASVLSGVGSFLLTSHKAAALCLLCLSILLLVATLVAHKTKNTPVGGVIVAIVTLAFFLQCGIGYLELRRPASRSSVTSITAPDSSKQQQGPNTADSKGNNSPAIAGSGNSVSYGAQQVENDKKKAQK